MAKNNTNYNHAWYALAATRIALGFIFLWAFLDKTMGLGYATPAAKAWVLGNSPTSGFLRGVDGPTADFFNALAGNVFVDWIFMIGLLGLGLSLILGVGLRIAAIAGTLLLSMMWAAALPMTTNPILDDHVIYALVLWVIALTPRKISFVEQWLSNKYVKNNSWLW